MCVCVCLDPMCVHFHVCVALLRRESSVFEIPGSLAHLHMRLPAYIHIHLHILARTSTHAHLRVFSRTPSSTSFLLRTLEKEERNTCMYTYTYKSVCLHLEKGVLDNIHVCIHIHTKVCVYIYIYEHMHTRLQVFSRTPSSTPFSREKGVDEGVREKL